MGTTYQAQVEVWREPIPKYDVPAQWQGISYWELQKDYGFSMAWSAVASEGWPDDHSRLLCGTAEEHARDYVFYEGRRWADGEFFKLLSYEDEWMPFQELRSHVLSLVGRGLKVRVFTWDE